jgi:hypothetical protein
MDDINIAKKTVFIDEFGNNGFEFDSENVSTHYIIAAIIIDTEKVSEIRIAADKIRNLYYKNGEIKSSHCNDNGKRFAILSDIIKLDFLLVGVVIDKREIYDGSNIKKFKNETFYKFLNRLLYTELKIFNTDLSIYADEFKDKEFRESFANYIGNIFPRTLINNNSFKFINSKDEVLIQIADFLAGTLSYGFEERKKCNEFIGFYSLLESKIVSLKTWPPPNIKEALNLIEDNKFDKLIAENCIKIVESYIEDHQTFNDDQSIDQLLVLKYLLNKVFINNPNEYFYVDFLIDYVCQRTGRLYTNQTFLSQIIAPMRDAGVIISSSSNGLKIPVKTSEVYAYSERTLNQVTPMLERLEKVRKRILAITNNELDIIDSDKYKRIRDYMDKI